MNFLRSSSSGLNEVIFENRNKNYGAYQIRSDYNETIIKSLFGLSSIIIMLFGINYTYNKINPVINIEAPLVFEDPIPEEINYSVPMEEPQTMNTKPPTQQPQQNISNSNTPPRIVDELPETTPQQLPQELSPSDLGTTSSIGTETTVNSNPSKPASNISENLTEVTPTVVIADEMPEFEGGENGLMHYIKNNVNYPSIAREGFIQGTVHVTFLVNEKGYIEEIKILKGIGYGCDEEVIRILNKVPKCKKAGKSNNRPVKVRYNIPVAFKLIN